METLLLIATEDVEAIPFPCPRENCPYVWRVPRGYIRREGEFVCPVCSSIDLSSPDEESEARAQDGALYSDARTALASLPDNMTLEVRAKQ